MSGGSAGGNSTVTSQPPQQFLNAYEQAVTQAGNVAQTPFQSYPGNLVAGFSPEQTSAIQEVNNAQGVAIPYLNAAGSEFNNATKPLWGGVQQFSPSGVQKYESPYTSDVVNATEKQFENTNEQQSQALTGNAISAGAYGGDRAAVAQGVLGGQQQAAEAPVIAGLENQGYSQALGEFNQQQQAQLGANEANAWLGSQAGFGYANLGNEALNTSLQGASAQLQTGGLEQQLGQENLNVPYEQFIAQQAAPYQNSQWYANIAEGLGGASGGQTTSTSSPSIIQDIAGLGTAGLGLADLAGGGAGVGAGLGAIGAFLGFEHGGSVVPHPTHPAYRGGVAANDDWHHEPERPRAYGGVAGYAAGGAPVGVAGGGVGGAFGTNAGAVHQMVNAASAISPELGGVIGVHPGTSAVTISPAAMAAAPGGGLSPADQAYFTNLAASESHAAPATYQPVFSSISEPQPTGVTGNSPVSDIISGVAGAQTGKGLSTQTAQTIGAMQGSETNAAAANAVGMAGVNAASAGAGLGGNPGIGEGGAGVAGGHGGVSADARGGVVHRDDGGDIPTPPIPPDYVPPGGGVAGGIGEPASPYAVNYTPPTGGDPNMVANIRSHARGLGLLGAGLGILGGKSLNAASNIGQGALEGLKIYQGETQRADTMAEKQGEIANEGQYKKANLDLEAQRFSDAADEARKRIAEESRHNTAQEGIAGGHLDLEAQRLAMEATPPEIRAFRAVQKMTPEQQAAYYNAQAVQKGMLPMYVADQFRGATPAASAPSGGPAAAGAAAPTAGETAVPGQKTGDAFLQTLPPQVQQMVKAIAQGRQTLPGRITPQTEQLIGLVAQYDPTYDATDYNKRARTAVDFSAGQSNKAVLALNTAMPHLETLGHAFDALDNGNVKLWNWAVNTLHDQTGDPAPNNAAEARDAVANELRKVFATTGGGGLEELRGWQERFPISGSAAQQKDAIKEAIALMDGRLTALADRYNSGMGTNHAGVDLLSPEARAAYAHLTGAAPLTDQTRPQTYAAPGSGAQGVTPQRAPIPEVGTIQKGYKFLGGDPSKPTSWAPVP